MKKIIKSLIIIASIFTFSLVITNHAEAKSKTTIKTVKTYKKPKALLKKTDSKEYLWNKKHTKKVQALTTVPKKTLYATKLVSIHFPNYQYNVKYYYVKSKDNKIKGYIWKGAVIDGTYINNGKASYFKYLNKNILASTNKINNEDNYLYDKNVYGQSNPTQLKKYARKPSIKELNQVISFFSNKNNQAKIPYENKIQTKNVRVIQRKYYYAVGKYYLIPILEMANNHKSSSYTDKMNFWTALEFTKINGKINKDYQNDSKTRCLSIDNIGFYFPNEEANQGLIENDLKVIYQGDFGKNKDLKLALDARGNLKFVKINSLITLPKKGFQLKNGVWFGTDYQPKNTNQLNPTKSKIYRQIYRSGFTQYEYTKNKWVPKFDIKYEKTTRSYNVKVKKIVNEKETIIDNKNYLTDFTDYLYKPANYYQ